MRASSWYLHPAQTSCDRISAFTSLAWVWAVPGLVAFLVAAAISLWIPAQPNIHDDFGNLLIADTLMHGRVCNPTPPSHAALQTFHVVMEPTYAAKFPIGSGATMAFGKLFFGTFASGMWLSAALACSLLAWMLAGHFSPRWSCAVGLMAALHPAWQTGWSQEFTQGWLAVASVALVLGGLVRIRRRMMHDGRVDASARTAATAIAAGLVLGIFTRPFEVALIASLLMLPLMWMIVVRGWILAPKFWLAAAPGICIVVSGLAMQGWINRCVTGSWSMMPYQLHEQQYAVAPIFAWQQPQVPRLGHRYSEQTRFHYGWSMDAYRSARSVQGYARLMGKRLTVMTHQWGWWLLVTPLALVVFPRERRLFGALLVSIGLALLVINAVPWVSANYVAPLVPVSVFLSAAVLRGGIRILNQQRHESASSARTPQPRLQWLVIVGLLTIQGLALIACTRAMAGARESEPKAWYSRRVQMEMELTQGRGNHLVLVRYAEDHNVHQEWVFNAAEPTHARVVWARWDPEIVESLLQDYPGRQVWILDVGANAECALQPYP